MNHLLSLPTHPNSLEQSQTAPAFDHDGTKWYSHQQRRGFSHPYSFRPKLFSPVKTTLPMKETLPKFDDPPVTETVLGIEFASLRQWDIPYFGLFWSRVREDYQNYSVKPPLVSQIEKFGESEKQEVTLELPLLSPPQFRCWFFDRSGTRLIQVQRDRFVHNWRKVRPDDEYPRYHSVRQRFEGEWQRFRDFVGSEQLGDLELRQCEVTYFNHIEPEGGWQSLSNLGEIFPCWAGVSSGGFLPSPEIVALNTSYLIPENRGRLRISMEPVFRHADAKEILQLTISAKVIVDSSDTAELMKAIDLGHEWAVRGFTDFTSARMHELWKRRQ
ncbi:MAG: TIGR04255 family protein [Blastocatellia bacterium]